MTKIMLYPLFDDCCQEAQGLKVTSRRLNVVVRSRPSIWEVGPKGKKTTPRGPIIRSPQIVWNHFFTSGPNLGAWPDCWVSVEFLHDPIPRKGSGSTTTTRVKSCTETLVEEKFRIL